MNNDILSGKWKQVKGSLRSKWGKLTDDDVETIAGKRDTLVGRLQQRYGMERDNAERQVDDWLRQI